MPYTQALIKLSSTRAWRTYKGGFLLDELAGKQDPSDTHYPEEWIISVVPAAAVGPKAVPDEGLSRIAGSPKETTLSELIDQDPERLLGFKHARRFKNQTGILVKAIDSAERLAIQVHPDRIAAAELFNSPFGKTECWHILGGRTLNGLKPCVYLGFKPGVTKERWMRLFASGNSRGMLDCLHKFIVKPGDTFLVEGGVPHAIGAGCFLVEIQEPTDLTIRSEKVTAAGLVLDDLMIHHGLGFEKMFDVFHYDGRSRRETCRKYSIKQRIVRQIPGGLESELVGYADTPYFRMTLLEVENALETDEEETFFGLYVLAGCGMVESGRQRYQIRKGEQFFVPAAAKKLRFLRGSDEPLRAVRCFPPQNETIERTLP